MKADVPAVSFNPPLFLHRDPRQPRTHQPKAALDARILATEAASSRILRALNGGTGQFILTSVDGSMSARIHLTVSDSVTTEHVVGKANLVVNWGRGTVGNGDCRVVLSRTELRLFGALLAAKGGTLSRHDLIASVWPSDELNPSERENALAVYVCSLRKRLTMIGAGDALVTVRRVGYRAAM